MLELAKPALRPVSCQALTDAVLIPQVDVCWLWLENA